MGTAFAAPLAVESTDAFGNPVGNVGINFAVTTPIAWGPVTPITSDVATLTQPGTVLEAAQWGNPGTISVTGSYGTIHFQPGSLNGSGPVADTTGNGETTGAFSGSTGNANFNSVLNGFAFQFATFPLQTVTIFGLTAGQHYTVQLFAVDDRTNVGETVCAISYSDTEGDTSGSFTEGSNSYVIGSFTANAATETIDENLLGEAGGNTNALVVRSVGGGPANVTFGSGTVRTNAAGIATTPALANDTAGSFTVTVSDPADGISTSLLLTNVAGARQPSALAAARRKTPRPASPTLPCCRRKSLTPSAIPSPTCR